MAEKNAETETRADDNQDREIVYYYSRAHRLSRAPRQVRALYESSSQPGLVKRIAGSKGNLFLMVSVLMVCVMLILTSRNRAPGTFKVGENDVNISFSRNEGVLSLNLIKTVPKNDFFYTGYVDIVVSPVQKKPPAGTENPPPEIMAERLFFTLIEEEAYSFSLPFDGDELLVALGTEDERIFRRLRPPK